MRSELWTPRQAARADAFTLERLGALAPVLMERAALAVASWVEELLPGALREGSIPILCGSGNNGADGVALGRILHLRGLRPRVHLVCAHQGESLAEQVGAARACGVTIEDGLPSLSDDAVLFVDALLGTGSQGPPRGPVADAIVWLSGRSPVLSVDLPSGLDGETGALHEPHIRATQTLSFERSKPGLHIMPALQARGRLRIARIGLLAPPEFGEDLALIDPARVWLELGALKPAQHKGERGHVCVLGGSLGTEGATILAGAGALAAGAGLVTLYGASGVLAPQLLDARPELMMGTWDSAKWVTSGDVLVVGPGLTDAAALSQVEPLWGSDARPSVWDASALDLELRSLQGPRERILTPHPKEAAGLLSRLSGRSWSVPEVQANRVKAARELASYSGACVALKGAGTIVADRERAAINVGGDERLATAGSGDVLAGIIGALLGRGLAGFDAACVGVQLHALAGEALPSVGARALDIADALPEVLADVGREAAGWPEFVDA